MRLSREETARRRDDRQYKSLSVWFKHQGVGRSRSASTSLGFPAKDNNLAPRPDLYLSYWKRIHNNGKRDFLPDTMSSFRGRAQSRMMKEWQPSMATTVRLWGLCLGGTWLAVRLSFFIRSSRTSTCRYSRASVKEQGAPGSFRM